MPKVDILMKVFSLRRLQYERTCQVGHTTAGEASISLYFDIMYNVSRKLLYPSGCLDFSLTADNF